MPCGTLVEEEGRVRYSQSKHKDVIAVSYLSSWPLSIYSVSHSCAEGEPADGVGTFTTGNEPFLLGDSATWWTEAGTSSPDYERYLGISKEMTEMVAKVSVPEIFPQSS